MPLRDDRALFELLILEGAQAGLSWSTILKKRERYREVFDGFQPHLIARYDDTKVAALLADLPPLYLNAAEIDPLCSDSQRLAARLHALGRGDVFDLVPGVTHGFMQMSLWLPQSVAAFRRAGDIFREMT